MLAPKFFTSSGKLIFLNSVPEKLFHKLIVLSTEAVTIYYVIGAIAREITSFLCELFLSKNETYGRPLSF
jgi:hypothetical protein